jgi:tetratricopeptide (TPR) repeat protein
MDSRPISPAGTGRRRVVRVVLPLVLAGLAAGVGWFVVWPAVQLNAAERSLARHDPAAARTYLDRCLAVWPTDPDALLLATRAARRVDACGDAERFLAAYEQAAGETDAGRLEWALLGAQQGDFAGEEFRLRTTADRNPQDAATILEALAKGYEAAYRRPDALAVLGRLIDQHPGHVPALVLRGTILDRVRQPGPAGDDFRKAVELAPQNTDARAALAGYLNRRGYTREAIAHYELVLRARPGDRPALLGLAKAYADAADAAAAERRLDELLAADPDHADALVDRGRLPLREGRPADAEPFLARAVRSAPWHREAYQLYHLALRDQGKTGEAAKCAARVAELAAEDAEGGRLKIRARDNPGDANVRWDLWLWSARNGQPEEGFAWLTEVVKLAPRHAQARAALAEYFEKAGQPRRADLHRKAAAGR